MNKFFLAIGTSAVVMLMAGCSTTTTIIEPGRDTTNVRQEGHISSEEMRQAAQAAVKNAMSSARFILFLKQYKSEMNNQNAIPLLKLDKAINNTTDPDLNTDELTDFINMELINAAKVDVTMAEGAGRTQAIGNSRKLERDQNFKQETVAKRDTLHAARLIMRPKVINNTTDDGTNKVIVTTFTMDMADIHTGTIIWKYSKQLGYRKVKGTFGW